MILTLGRLLKNHCGEPSTALRGTRNKGYLYGMPRLLRSRRLASGLPHDAFQQPAKTPGMEAAVVAAVFCLLLVNPLPAWSRPSQADRVLVMKKERLMVLLKDGKVLRSYKIALGRQPVGRKSCQGDMRTPEGMYVLDRRNERSRFYKSLHISYPNSADVAASRRRGVNPGGDIMIHGLPKGFEELGDMHTARNWTKGCIAVSNVEIDEIWNLVPNGTPIEISP